MHHPLNLRVLQRHDSTITDILELTSYAVLYKFSDDKWSKTGKEGTLFVYDRCGHLVPLLLPSLIHRC